MRCENHLKTQETVREKRRRSITNHVLHRIKLFLSIKHAPSFPKKKKKRFSKRVGSPFEKKARASMRAGSSLPARRLVPFVFCSFQVRGGQFPRIFIFRGEIFFFFHRLPKIWKIVIDAQLDDFISLRERVGNFCGLVTVLVIASVMFIQVILKTLQA